MISSQFAIFNQVKQQGQDNFKAFKQELGNIPQQILFDVYMHDDLKPEEYEQANNELISTWIKPSAQSADELYGKISTEHKSQDVTLQEQKRMIDFLEKLHQKLPFLENRRISSLEECKKKVEEITNRMMDRMPEYLESRETDEDLVVEVVQETEKQSQLETQEAKEVSGEKLGYIRGFKKLKEFDDF